MDFWVLTLALRYSTPSLMILPIVHISAAPQISLAVGGRQWTAVEIEIIGENVHMVLIMDWMLDTTVNTRTGTPYREPWILLIELPTSRKFKMLSNGRSGDARSKLVWPAGSGDSRGLLDLLLLLLLDLDFLLAMVGI